MKKRMFLILALVAVLLLTSCVPNVSTENTQPQLSGQETTPETTTPSTSAPETTEQTEPTVLVYPVSEKIETYLSSAGQLTGGSMKKILDDIAASPEINNVAADLYKLEDFQLLGLSCLGWYSTYASISSSLTKLVMFNKLWPVSNIRAVNDELVYTTYTIEKDGGLYRAYFFFARSWRTSQQEIWKLTGNVFFMNKTLSFSDFSGISVGCTIEQVAAIDPVADFQFLETWKQPFETKHILEDGILTISYTWESEGGIPKVTDISFDKDFNVKGFSSDATYNFRIDPEDYVNY